MTRSAEFATTVKSGVRAVQPDLIVHVWRCGESGGPRIGFIVSKAVGGAVERHRVTRRLRHASRLTIPDLSPSDRIVVRALPSIRRVGFDQLRQEIVAGVRKATGAGVVR